MFVPGAEWSDIDGDLNAWFKECLAIIRKKTEHHRGGVLVIQDVSLLFESYVGAVAKGLHALLSPRPVLIKEWTVVLHSRLNCVQFASYLITARQPLQHRADTPTGSA
jgi:hypothetical protein